MNDHNSPNQTPIEVLLVEDNPGDARLIQEAFKEGKIRNRLHVVKDGVEAMAFLRQEDSYREVPKPDLIILDLNLPRMSGKEVLAAIKGHPKWKTMPVLILTTSQAETDVVQSYELHANCYLIKPLELQAFMNVVLSVEDFWLSIVKLPPR